MLFRALLRRSGQRSDDDLRVALLPAVEGADLEPAAVLRTRGAVVVDAGVVAGEGHDQRTAPAGEEPVGPLRALRLRLADPHRRSSSSCSTRWSKPRPSSIVLPVCQPEYGQNLTLLPLNTKS